MTKLNAAWIVLIVFCSLIVIGGVFYLFYRLYINKIYKRRRVWKEISSPMKNRMDEAHEEERATDLIPRQSIMPFIEEFLADNVRKQTERRQMVTELQFDEAPLFEKNFSREWNEMDDKSALFSSLVDKVSFSSSNLSRFTLISISHVYSNVVLHYSRRHFRSRDG